MCLTQHFYDTFEAAALKESAHGNEPEAYFCIPQRADTCISLFHYVLWDLKDKEDVSQLIPGIFSIFDFDIFLTSFNPIYRNAYIQNKQNC